MDEILKKLLESDLLNEETKAEIAAQFKAAADAYLAEERSKLEVEVRASLTEEFVKAREELAESVNTRVDELLDKEITELKDDINKFRDLEVEYAEKLVEEKESLAQQLSEQLNQLVDKLDAFLEVRLDEEFGELREDIDEVKKLEFGRRIFEAIEAEFKTFRRGDLDKVEQELAEATDKLSDAERKISELEAARLSEARETKLDELLVNLTGNAREQMKLILSNVATEKLDEAYKVYIGKVLKEAVVEPKKEEAKVVITESKPAPGNTVTGNEKTEEDDEPAAVQHNEALSRLQKLAGLKVHV